MVRRTRIHISLVILIALAAFLLMRVQLASHNASRGHRLAEAWCTPCHAIEPLIAPEQADALAKYILSLKTN
jgi:hypothetical protein